MPIGVPAVAVAKASVPFSTSVLVPALRCWLMAIHVPTPITNTTPRMAARCLANGDSKTPSTFSLTSSAFS